MSNLKSQNLENLPEKYHQTLHSKFDTLLYWNDMDLLRKSGMMLPDDSSGDPGKDPQLDSVVEKLIKDNLTIIVLCMLKDTSMCGYDIIKKIFEDHNVFLSQGTVYPLLYSLKEEGILKAEHNRGNMRSKMYSITDEGMFVVEDRINNFVQAGDYFLHQIIRGER